MPRNCLIAILLWVVLVAAYGVFLLDRAPVALAPVVASLTWLGLLMMNGLRTVLRDWRLRRRAGEPPEDGVWMAAIGEVRPVFEALEAPMSGRACVAYRYSIGRDYSGVGFTRCTVGAYALCAVPVMEGFARDRVEGAQRYIAETRFVSLPDAREIALATLSLYTMPAPLRRDWLIGTAPAEPGEATETIVPAGAAVTAYGRYSAATHALIDVRLQPGEGYIAPDALARFVSGFVLVGVAHLILWVLLEHVSAF